MAKQLYSKAQLKKNRKELIKMKYFDYFCQISSVGMVSFSYYLMYVSASLSGYEILKIINNDVDKSLDNVVLDTLFTFLSNYLGIKSVKDIMLIKKELKQIKKVIIIIDELIENIDKLSTEELINMNNQLDKSIQKILEK